MALEANVCCGSGGAMSLSFRGALKPFPSRVSLLQSIEPRRVPFLALAIVKRSPKRLKYSAPRFSKEDGLLYVEVDPSGADGWKLDPVVKLLKEGAVGVIPTDTVYAIVCDLKSQSAIERLRRSLVWDSFRGNLKSLWLCCLCECAIVLGSYYDASYTFILTASKELPKQCTRYGTTTSKYAYRKNVGVRIPDDSVCQAILEKMDAPLISTSAKSPKENGWIIDPVVIADVYGPEGLDFVIDAGVRVADPSTVVDMTGSFPRIIRQGKGPKQPWMVAEDDKDSAVEEEEPTPYAA
ncbi:hypothetical protein TEA_028629 [Camellia sinensis var. sinensis]|uniref:Threonylcarbamoyl-AMP synthase n=1 Tax=Camellia sinensis var. sinensis TaxID=542762 RepID=A0A4S4EZK8_CAMSN|nr:hypothetical protein TEA_028629 [Camellia sinensis var. sinensis]